MQFTPFDKTLPKLIQYAFYLFIISIPFETLLISMGLFDSEVTKELVGSLSRWTGTILLIVSLLYIKKIIRRVNSQLVIYALIYIVVYFFSYFINSFSYSFPISLISLLSIPWLITLFIFSSGIFSYPTVRDRSVKLLMISISTCAFLQLIGAAYSREQIWINNISNFTRISSFGVDPNFVGYQYSIGLLIAITILFGLLESGKFIWIISFLSGLVNLLALLQTGSRGAIISLVFSIFTLPMVKKPLKIKIRILFYIIVFIGVLYTIIQNNIGLYMRFIQTFIYFDTANRIEIYSAAIKTLISRPVIGYGPYYNLFILPKYYYIGPILDTHNIFLWVLTSSGIIGFVPFALIILISGINAYKSRIGKDNIVPFSLFCLLFMFSQTVTNINNKLFWIILAYAASSNFFLRLSNKNINKEIVSAMRPEILETKSPVNY